MCGGLLALALAVPVPSLGQLLELDVNADGVSDSRDVLGPSIRAVDVYLTTDRNADGQAVVCLQDSTQDRPEGLALLAYTLILRSWGDGEVRFRSWVPGPAVSSFTQEIATVARDQDFYVAYVGFAALAPGRYRLGSLLVEVTGSPRLSFVTSTDINAGFLTGFGSPCPGEDFENAVRLGHDFLDARGTAPGPPRIDTVWEAVQQLYR